jgi:hypothetical protein
MLTFLFLVSLTATTLLLLAVAAEEVSRVTSALLTRDGAEGNLRLPPLSDAAHEQAIGPDDRRLYARIHSPDGHRTDGQRIPDQAA